jgi:hypothetical protein
MNSAVIKKALLIIVVVVLTVSSVAIYNVITSTRIAVDESSAASSLADKSQKEAMGRMLDLIKIDLVE